MVLPIICLIFGTETAADMEIIPIIALVVAVAFPLCVGFLASIFGNGGDSDWYEQLNTPPWTPPGWAFPVIWSILYIMMGVSSWFVWLRGGFRGQKLPLGVYALQILLNFLWTPIFFGLHEVALALVEIVFLWVAIVATIYLFWKVKPLAGYLLLPYLFWVTLATSINFYIWIESDASASYTKGTFSAVI